MRSSSFLYNMVKALTLFAVLLIPVLSFCQSVVVTQHRLKGDSLREAGHIESAIVAYKNDFRRNPDNAINIYNLACLFAVSGRQDSAFHYLFQYLKRDTEVTDFYVLTDADWISFHDDPRWKQVERDRMNRYQTFSKNAIKDTSYALLLLRMYATDQYYRKDLSKVEEKFGMNSPEVRKLWEKQTLIDQKNLQTLLNQINKKGWPKISVVGRQAASSAFLVVQHSNQQVMEKFLPELKRLCEQSEASCENYALMYDRVQVARTGTQLYGSQVYYDDKKKQWALNPITDKENLVKRRKEMGMQPIEEYVVHWGIKYDPGKQRPKPLPARLPGYPVDTIFRRGQRIVRQYSDFSGTKTGDFPLGWQIGTTPWTGVHLIGLKSFQSNSSYIATLNEQRALVVADSVNARVWDKRAGLTLCDNNASLVQLPNAFTLECSFYMEDSVCRKNGVPEFEIYFKEPKAKFKNELNVRIFDSGAFEMNCESNNACQGPNSPQDFITFYWSYVRATGKNTAYHQEVRGSIPGTYDKKSWHKLSLSYSHAELRCWLDGRFLGNINSCINPAFFRIISIATFGINNIVLAELNAEDDLTTLTTTKKLVTHSIYFDVNGFDVKKESLPFLKQIADWMTNNKGARLEISGHTDASGNATTNAELSQERAEAIRNQLIKFGIEENRLIAKGFGAEKPMYSNATEEGKAGNRRIEFLVR